MPGKVTSLTITSNEHPALRTIEADITFVANARPAKIHLSAVIRADDDPSLDTILSRVLGTLTEAQPAGTSAILPEPPAGLADQR